MLVATGAEGRQREYDFRPEKPGKEPKEPKAQWRKDMAAKLETDDGREKYRLRQQTVVPVFGIVKSVLGFRQFSLRGIDKVCGEWKLVALGLNFKRLHNLVIEQTEIRRSSRCSSSLKRRLRQQMACPVS